MAGVTDARPGRGALLWRPPPVPSHPRRPRRPGASPPSTGSTTTRRCTPGRSRDLEAFWAAVDRVHGRALARRPDADAASATPCPAPAGSPAARSTTPSTPWPRPPSAPDAVAVVAHSQTRAPARAHVGRAARQVGGRAPPACAASASAAGDRVVAYAPNIPETLVAFLAAASIGAMWSSCAPEFGVALGDRPLRARSSRSCCSPSTATATAPRTSTAVATRSPRSSPPCPRCATSCTCPYLGIRRADDGRRPARRWTATSGRPADLALRGRCRPTTRSTCCSARGRPGCPRPIVHGHGGIVARAPKVLALHQTSARRPLLLVHHHRLDDVELPRVGAARRRDRSCCSTAIPAAPSLARCGTWRRRPVHRASACRRRS